MALGGFPSPPLRGRCRRQRGDSPLRADLIAVGGPHLRYSVTSPPARRPLNKSPSPPLRGRCRRQRGGFPSQGLSGRWRRTPLCHSVTSPPARGGEGNHEFFKGLRKGGEGNCEFCIGLRKWGRGDQSCSVNLARRERVSRRCALMRCACFGCASLISRALGSGDNTPSSGVGCAGLHPAVSADLKTRQGQETNYD